VLLLQFKPGFPEIPVASGAKKTKPYDDQHCENANDVVDFFLGDRRSLVCAFLDEMSYDMAMILRSAMACNIYRGEV